jgi:hypothetical protein
MQKVKKQPASTAEGTRRTASSEVGKTIEIEVTDRQPGRVKIERVRLMAGNGARLDCDADTDAINEFYLLHDRLWRRVNPAEAGMLCLSCCEQRLGRKLRRADFKRLSLS